MCRCLCSCDLISEGLDVPAVGAVILLRPTQSLGLFLQQVGCGPRRWGKDALVVLDHAANIGKHGLPDDDCGSRSWTARPNTPAAAREEEAGSADTPEARDRVPRAGSPHLRDITLFGREVEQREGVLEELTPHRIRQIKNAPLRHVLMGNESSMNCG